MNEDLAAVVRNLAREEAIAAELDRPYSAQMRDRYVRDVRRRRAAGVSAVALLVVAVAGAGAFGMDRLTREVPPADVGVSTPTPSWSASWSPTPVTAPPETRPTSTPVETPSAPPTTAPADEPEAEETTPAPLPAPPGAVTDLYAQPGGGSGEIEVVWEPVEGATGYTVYRSDAADGSYAAAASYDVATGAVTIRWTGWYEYIGVVQGMGSPTAIVYHDAISNQGFFRVAAFNAGGEGPWSTVVCAAGPYSSPPVC